MFGKKVESKKVILKQINEAFQESFNGMETTIVSNFHDIYNNYDDEINSLKDIIFYRRKLLIQNHNIIKASKNILESLKKFKRYTKEKYDDNFEIRELRDALNILVESNERFQLHDIKSCEKEKLKLSSKLKVNRNKLLVLRKLNTIVYVLNEFNRIHNVDISKVIVPKTVLYRSNKAVKALNLYIQKLFNILQTTNINESYVQICPECFHLFNLNKTKIPNRNICECSQCGHPINL